MQSRNTNLGNLEDIFIHPAREDAKWALGRVSDSDVSFSRLGRGEGTREAGGVFYNCAGRNNALETVWSGGFFFLRFGLEGSFAEPRVRFLLVGAFQLQCWVVFVFAGKRFFVYRKSGREVFFL